MKILNMLFSILIIAWLIISGQGSVNAVRCTAAKPDRPDLFQIDATKTSAKLYFSPVNNAITNYTIIYGLSVHSPDYNVSFPFGQYDGVVSYTINDLTPNTKYYFRVRADNGCRQGNWSGTLSAVTDEDFRTYTKFKDPTELETTKITPTKYVPNFPDSTLSTEIYNFEEDDLTQEEKEIPLTSQVLGEATEKEEKKFSLGEVIYGLYRKLIDFLLFRQ